jgi:hypothetical protein
VVYAGDFPAEIIPAQDGQLFEVQAVTAVVQGKVRYEVNEVSPYFCLELEYILNFSGTLPYRKKRTILMP